MDYAALPPEINSARMYSGGGSGPMLSAAAAWDRLAAGLGSAASSYQAVITELTDGPWQGQASASMAAAAAPYVAWMTTTAAAAKQTATQARAAAAAYQAAHTGTVPPPVIAANRALLTSLVATNTFGQNTPAIAANQAAYSEMWAQDASAMYGYAAASTAAATLTSFAEAPQTTNPTGTANQAAAQAASSTPDWLQQLLAGTGPQWLLNLLSSTPVQEFEGLMAGTAGYQGLIGGPAFMLSGGLFTLAPMENAAMTFAMAASAAPAAMVTDVSVAADGALGTLAGASGTAEASASLARAGSVGGLSVPQSWGSAAPAIRLASAATALDTGPAGGMFSGPIGPIGSVVNASRSGAPAPRSGARSRGGADQDGALGRWAGFDGLAPDSGPASERDQLNGLRKAVSALSKERDVLKRSATLLIKEAMHQ